MTIIRFVGIVETDIISMPPDQDLPTINLNTTEFKTREP